jgi:prepilin-type processing-associated H-X9-DG protein
LLPYLDQRPVYDATNFNLNCDPDYTTSNSSATHMTASITVVTTLLCPSDGGPSRVVVGNGQYAGHNYLLNVGSGYSVVSSPPAPMTPPNGIFFENHSVRLAEMSDGTTQTVCISESIRSTDGAPTGFSPASAFARDPLGGFVITGNNSAGNGPPIVSDVDYAAKCLTNSPPGFQPTRGIKWLYGAPGHSMYNHRRPPNDRRYDCRGGLPHSTQSPADWQNLSLNITARSHHPGGVHSLFADGHVQFIKDSVNAATWQALGSRNGGEIASADGY